MKKASWFTLVEILIVLVLVGILSAILFRSYTRISQVAFRVQQTKRVHQELLSLSQILQNFVDRNTIDYSKYASGELLRTQWIVSDLYLSGQDGSLHIFTTGDCLLSWSKLISRDICSLVLQQSGTSLVLNDSHSALLRMPVFKIFPFASTDAYLQQEAVCPQQDYLHCVQTPGFWFLFTIYSSNYNEERSNKVRIPGQLFFTK